MPTELTLSPEVRGSLSVYPITGVRPFGVDAFVTDRFGGVSAPPYDSLNLALHVGDRPEAVALNRARVADALGVGVDRLVIVRQVHGNGVVASDDVTPVTEADAIVTDAGGPAVAVLVADCVPILLVDPRGPRACVVHAGWRGLECGVLAASLARFDAPSTLHAFIGPCISAEGYQVGPEVAERFVLVPGALYPDAGDRFRLDLRQVTLHQLRSLGVDDARITVCRQSTDGGGSFFSDRGARPCGRFGLVARAVLA